MKHEYFLAAVAICMATPAAAQLGPENYPDFDPGADLRNGYSAEELRQADVYGANGKQVAEVEDVIISSDNTISRLVVAVNEGLFDTGGRRLAVDWQDVQVGQRDGYEINYLTVDASDGNLEESGLFKDGKEAVRGGTDEWRASELVGDDVNFKDSTDDGYVSDLMFDKDGELRVVATTAILEGSALNIYAGYTRDGWEPGDDAYVVPYSEQQLRELLPGGTTQARN